MPEYRSSWLCAAARLLAKPACMAAACSCRSSCCCCCCCAHPQLSAGIAAVNAAAGFAAATAAAGFATGPTAASAAAYGAETDLPIPARRCLPLKLAHRAGEIPAMPEEAPGLPPYYFLEDV
jgi:hypothetical protein